MNDNKARDPVFSHELADYIDVGAAGEPDIVCIRVAEELSESPNMQTVTKHYTGSRSAIEIPVGFQTDISFSVDMYKHEKVVLWLRDIAEEQKLGTQAAVSPRLRVRKIARRYLALSMTRHTFTWLSCSSTVLT